MNHKKVYPNFKTEQQTEIKDRKPNCCPHGERKIYRACHSSNLRVFFIISKQSLTVFRKLSTIFRRLPIKIRGCFYEICRESP